MDFREKRSEAKLIRAGFRVKASECEQRKTKRDAKKAERLFSCFNKSNRRKQNCGKNFFFFLRKSPYFWGKKLCLLKKSIFIYRKSIKIYRKSINPQSIFVKPNTPFLRLLCLYNLLGFLGCSLLLGFPLAPTLRAGASPSRGSFCSLRSHPNGCRGAPL